MLAKRVQKSYDNRCWQCSLFRIFLAFFTLCEVKRKMYAVRKLCKMTGTLLPLNTLLPALFLLIGIVSGYACAGRFALGSGAELRTFLDGSLTGPAARPMSFDLIAETLVCYFRAPFFAFLLGFASIGVVCLPLLFAAQGFVLSFSLVSFAVAFGRDGFLFLIALFAVRLLFVLPCTFLLGSASMERSYALALLSLGGKRTRPVVYGAAYWYRCFACCVCLLIGSALELWLVPLMLGALM